MHNAVKSVIESRISHNHFQAGREIPEASIEELVALATMAPSAFNCQNWRFLAVNSNSSKAELQSLSYGQAKIGEAAMVFIVIGELAVTSRLASTLNASVTAGAMPSEIAERWLAMANDAYLDPQKQRDEAVRSASLAAMTLMLAAEGMGLVSCPMSGFDAAGVARTFSLDASEIPVLLVAVGYPASITEIRKPRRQVAEVLEYA